MKTILKIVVWVAVVFVVLFIGFAILGFWHKAQLKKTADAIERINARKIDLDDVMGKNLPPKPDQQLNDSTVAGIDANNNGIRDDVELAIFEKYPNSAKIRAAMLQYAQELQSEFSDIFNNDTWIAVAKDENNGISCLVDLAFGEYNNTVDQINKSKEWIEEIEKLVFNNDLRVKKREYIKRYETAYAVGDGKCDISLSYLQDK